MKDKKLARSITRLASGYGIVSDLPKEKHVDSIKKSKVIKPFVMYYNYCKQWW